MATLTKSMGTVTLTGAAEKVTFPAVYGWVWVKNLSDSDIFAGLSEDISEGADGVMTISAGECGRVQADGFRSVYLLGTGNALIVAQNYADCPFKVGAKGGVTVGGNLLINPDFKINQRGNTSFTVSYHTGSPIPQSQLYTVDRWRLMEGKADILEGKFVLNGTIIQVLENGIGENFTASVSVESGAATASYDDGTKTFTIVGDAAVLNWAKLEHGGTATQFIPPDTAAELVKCKRYYRAFGANFNLNTVGRYYHNKNNQFTYYLDVPMRVNPDVIFTNCGVKLVSEPYSDIEVNSYNSLSTKYALFVYCTMDNLYEDAMFYVKSENGLKLDAEIY